MPGVVLISAQHPMAEPCRSWRTKAKELGVILGERTRHEARALELLDELNSIIYPVDGLISKDAEQAVVWVRNGRSVQISEQCTVKVAQLVSSLITYQKTVFSDEIQTQLLDLFLSSLPRGVPPTEPLYASAALAQCGTLECPSQTPESLLQVDSLVMTMALSPSHSVETHRAALHYLTTVCNKANLPRQLLLAALDVLVQTLVSSPVQSSETGKSEGANTDVLLQAKLLQSQLKFLHALLSPLNALQSSNLLPTILASLKANMVFGLPGQSKASIASIHPPLSVPLSPHTSPRPNKLLQTVAGPQARKKEHRNKSKEKKSKSSSHSGSGDSSRSSDQQSSDSELSDSSQKASGGSASREKISYSSSDSEVSDSESTWSRMKVVNSKIRLHAHSCLATVFKNLDRHTAFSYWTSFLPDGPRPPHSSPSLLTCIIKDPVPKCRGGAVSVLCSMLEGSKSYLAAAEDKPLPSQPFTPYSVTLGNIVRELHRSLLLALSAETHPTTLTQIIKALSLVVANTPYHRLMEGYIGRVASSLHRFSMHRDSNVQVGCLTCYGAMVSITPPFPEVQSWLTSPNESPPWLLQHCTILLQSHSPPAVKTECLQVLAALSKFYFPQLSPFWHCVKDVYFSHLAIASDTLQNHTLKMLEELCRSLSSRGGKDVVEFWERLLAGPLTVLLQNTAKSVLCTQACSVLATIGEPTMANMKAPCQMLCLTLPLGLSKDVTIAKTVIASAIRVLGVFVQYECLAEDSSFIMDCQSAILHCLDSTSLPVRVQASWALANLTDKMSPSFPPSLLPALYKATCSTLTDNDKVKCNGVRAAGSLLRRLDATMLSSNLKLVEEVSSLLAKCVNTGSVKSRWNACYACHSGFSNVEFSTKCLESVELLLAGLCQAVHTCKNFKVRNNAALALSTAVHYYPLAGAEQFISVWAAVLLGLENSEHQVVFSEYKHAGALKTQLCFSLCNLLSVMTPSQAAALSHQPLSDSIEGFIKDILQSSLKEDSEGSKWGEIVDKARQNLAAAGLGNETGEPTSTVSRLRKLFEDIHLHSAHEPI